MYSPIQIPRTYTRVLESYQPTFSWDRWSQFGPFFGRRYPIGWNNSSRRQGRNNSFSEGRTRDGVVRLSIRFRRNGVDRVGPASGSFWPLLAFRSSEMNFQPIRWKHRLDLAGSRSIGYTRGDVSRSNREKRELQPSDPVRGTPHYFYLELEPATRRRKTLHERSTSPCCVSS